LKRGGKERWREKAKEDRWGRGGKREKVKKSDGMRV
jgi:hypothetical protein